MKTAKPGVRELGPVPLTLLVPLWARATETRRPSPILTDWTAVSTAGSLDFDFHRLGVRRDTIVGACARTAIIDGIVSDLCRSDPRLVLVNIGEGLDNRFARVDNGRMSCIDLDLPEVIRLRANFTQETSRHRLVPKSVLDYTWMDEVDSGDRTIVLVAEGVLMYLPLEDVRRLFARTAERFPGTEVIFDTVVPALVRFGATVELGRGLNARYQWGVKHAGEIEAWGEGYKLQERHTVFRTHLGHFGLLVRAVNRLLPSAAWAHSISRVRLGNR